MSLLLYLDDMGGSFIFNLKFKYTPIVKQNLKHEYNIKFRLLHERHDEPTTSTSRHQQNMLKKMFEFLLVGLLFCIVSYHSFIFGHQTVRTSSRS